MSQYIAKYDVCVSLKPMPMSIKGLIKRCGDYDCIVINENLSDVQKQKAFLHEIKHKEQGDLDSEKPVSEIEKGVNS